MDKNAFPRRSEFFRPVRRFWIGDRYLSLYFNVGRHTGEEYSLYYDDEDNPVQHNMTLLEVLNVISYELEKTKGEPK